MNYGDLIVIPWSEVQKEVDRLEALLPKGAAVSIGQTAGNTVYELMFNIFSNNQELP